MSRYLFVCDAGCVRSHAMMVAMKRRGHEAINVGRHNMSADSMRHFCEWADHVVITAANQAQSIPADFANKLTLANIGVDVWGIGMPDGWFGTMHPDLYPLAERLVDELLAS